MSSIKSRRLQSDGTQSKPERLYSGLQSLDCIRFLNAPPATHDLVRLPDGLSFVRLPQLQATDWYCEGSDAHRLIMVMQPLAHLLQPPSSELATRRLLDRSFVLLPAKHGTEWIVGGLSFPRTLQLHIDPRLSGHLSKRPLMNRPHANLRDPILERIMLLADGELGGDNEFRTLALHGYGLAAVARLAALENWPVASLVSALGPGRMKKLREHVEENLHSQVSVVGMAAVLGFSTSHFIRAFRLETGKTPYAWILALRVQRAKELISGGKYSLVEVAGICGFSSQSHMTETFRRLEGVSPGRWRQRNEDDESLGNAE